MRLPNGGTRPKKRLRAEDGRAAATIRRMAQGKRISVDIDEQALLSIKALGAAARQARLNAGEGQAVVAARLGVHVQTIARIESGEPGVSVGHMLGLLALCGLTVSLSPTAQAQS